MARASVLAHAATKQAQNDLAVFETQTASRCIMSQQALNSLQLSERLHAKGRAGQLHTVQGNTEGVGK
jgi:hypothetical protein